MSDVIVETSDWAEENFGVCELASLVMRGERVVRSGWPDRWPSFLTEARPINVSDGQI